MENCGLLSIIVPVYKVESYLPRCVDSVLAQTVSDFELILVDDGSPDRCGAICDEYAAQDSRVRVIHKENGGLSSARNAGIDIARGQWLGFVDSDDYITPDCYEKLLSCARRRNVKLVCAGRWDVSEKTVETTPGLCPEKEETVSGMELARRIFTWDHLDSAAWDKLYRADLFSDIRYPLGRVNEDTPVTYRLALKAGEAALCPERVYCYYHRQGSITYSKVSEKTFHFSEHTRQILQNCREQYPELVAPARFMNIRAHAYNLKMLDTALPEDRERFSRQYRDSRRELGRELPFLLGCGYATPREKLEDTLLAAGLYRPMRKAFRFLRGKR